MIRYARGAWLAVEHQLAHDVPFGSAGYIRERGARVYRRRLGTLGESLDEAARFARELDASPSSEVESILADPVLRGTIDDLLCCYLIRGKRTPEPAQLEFFAHYDTNPQEVIRDAWAEEGLLRQDVINRPIRVWTDTTAAQTHRSRAFAALLRRHTSSPHVYTVEAEAAATLHRALALLAELLPEVASSATSHLQFIAVDDFDSEVGSATIAGVLGTIFLARTSLRTPWTAAEAILHECMHLKFVELEHTHSLLARGYSEKTSPRIHPPWHEETVTWPVNRTLTAAHVYVTLALYSHAAQVAAPELEEKFGPCRRSRILVHTNTAAERARILIDLLSEHTGSLGQAGRAFLTWMDSLLRTLGAVSPARP